MKLLNLDRADFEPNLLDTGIQLVRIDFLLLNRLVVEGNFAKLLECVLWAELLRSDPERELPERCLVVHFIDSVKVFLCTVDGRHRPHLRMRHLALVIVVVSSANVGRFVLDCTGGTLRVERLRMQLIHINCQVVFQVLSGILVQLQKLIPLVFQVLSELAQVGEVLDGLLCELRFSDLLFFLNGFVKVCVEFRIPHQELVECHCDQIPPHAEYADVRNFHIHSPFFSGFLR